MSLLRNVLLGYHFPGTPRGALFFRHFPLTIPLRPDILLSLPLLRI